MGLPEGERVIAAPQEHFATSALSFSLTEMVWDSTGITVQQGNALSNGSCTRTESPLYSAQYGITRNGIDN
jgi:aspartyl aminopeptidase